MDNPSPLLKKWSIPATLIIGGITLFALLYFSLAQPLAAGILYDDGMYIMGALSLAAGEGYTLPWVEGSPLIYKYPPLFSAFLALPALCFQSFQDKLTAFFVLNFLFSLGAFGLIFWLYRRYYGFSSILAAGLLIMIATHWRFLEPATAIMTEPLYLLLIAGLLIVYQRQQGSTGAAKSFSWLVILLGMLAFYARTIGILAIAAVVLHQLWQRRIKSAVLYAIAFAVGILPWLWWSTQQPDTTWTIHEFLVRTFQENYTHTLQMDLSYEHGDLRSLYAQGVSALIAQLGGSLFPWLETFHPVKNLLFPLNFLLFALLLLWPARCLRQKEVSLIGIYLGLYLLALPFWSFHDQYPRFFAVIVPFLLPQLILLIQLVLKSQRAQRVALALFLTLGIVTNLMLVAQRIHQNQANETILADYHFVFDTLREKALPQDVLWSDTPMDSMMLGLWTQRLTLDFFLFYPGRLSPQTPPEELAALFRQKAHVLYQILLQKKVQYVVINHALLTRNQAQSGHVVPKADPATRFLMQDFGDRFEKVADSPHGAMTIYRTRFAPDATP